MATKANIGARIILDGEKEYRQAITNVGKSMSSLKSELKAVSVEYEGQANSLSALRAKNEIYIKQQAEQEKKLKLLRGALDEVTKVYGENSEQAQAWQTKLNNAYAELNRINKSLDSNQRYMKEAENSTDKTAKSIDQFGKQVKDTKEETLKFGDILKANLASEAIIEGVKGLTNALRDGARAMIGIVKETAAYADNILTISAQTGIATDTLQELNYMAELTDTSIETVTKTMAKNIKSMNSAKDGSESFAKAYKSLGVDVIDPVTRQLRDSGTVYWEAVDALGKMANETERDAIAMKLFGKSAQDLNPLIKVGKDGMAGFAKEARDMGAVLSDETLQSLGETDDALQRLYQQIAVTKREFGQALAPAMTDAFEKVSNKLGEVDDKFADFAGGALTDIIDGFVWMIDHSDLIIAGLKGMTAAIITKKAADGVTYAVQAYKTLTTTVKAATAAQVAFNTASKANVIGGLISLAVGLGVSLLSLGKNSDKAAENVKKLSDKTQELIDKSKELREEIEDRTKVWKEETDSIEAEYGAMELLASKLYDLSGKENKSNDEKRQMVALVKQLNDTIPNLNLKINEQTGALSMQKAELTGLIEAQKELYLVRAAEKNYTALAEERVSAEIQLNELYKERDRLYGGIIQQQYKYNSITNGMLFSDNPRYEEAAQAKKTLLSLQDGYDAVGESIEQLEGVLKQNDARWTENEQYIKKYSEALDATGKSFENFIDKYEKSLERQTDSDIINLEDRLGLVSRYYDEAEDLLDDRLRAEEKAIEKSQEKRQRAIEKAKDNELSTLEKAHKEKLKLINEEYIEKQKNIDEERYKELKAVQDQIDSIDAEQEAEDRAKKLQEESEKKAELKARIENAKTVEERLEAQKELTEYEADLARERLKAERGLQKDILKEQKDTINKSYDAKIKALESEKKEEETAASEQLKKDQEALAERYRLKIEELKDEQDAEKTSFKDRQDKYKEYLKKQRELASENAKKIYEDDLTQFKLNQAMKYDPNSVDTETAKKFIKNYAYNSMDPGVARDAILRTNDLQEMLKYYNPKEYLDSISKQSPQEIDYGLFAKAIKDAMKDMKLVLNDKIVGKMVEDTVNNMVR